MRILIITSDFYISEELIKQLTDGHHRIEFADKAVEAIELARKRSFEVAIVDTCLPDIQGADLIKILKIDHPELKFIAMSDHNSRETEMAVRKQGVLYYMLKSSDIQHLNIILSHIEKKCPKIHPGHNETVHYLPM